MAYSLNFSYPIITLDTETGGLNSNHIIQWEPGSSVVKHKLNTKVTGVLKKLAAPILEIGAIKQHPMTLDEESYFHTLCGKDEGETFDAFISRCDKKALELNGFGNRLEELREDKPFSVAIKEFINWLPSGKYIPCGQNVRFDIDMINSACVRYGVDFQIRTTPLELISYSMLYFAMKDTEIVANYKLTTTASALGISTENAHTALADVRMTAACMKKMFKKFSES